MGHSIAMVIGQNPDALDFLDVVLNEYSEVEISPAFSAMRKACELVAAGKNLQLIVILDESEASQPGCDLLTRLRLCSQLRSIRILVFTNNQGAEDVESSCDTRVCDGDDDDLEYNFNKRPPPSRKS